MLVLPLRLEQSIRQGKDSQPLFGHDFLGCKNPFALLAIERRRSVRPSKNMLQRGSTVFGRALAKRRGRPPAAHVPK